MNGRRWQRLAWLGVGLALAGLLSVPAAAAERPNILWITCEDMSPTLGCWGDRYATTPNLDRFAAESVRYVNAFATAPVCSPARSCLITGVYATTLGTQNLRSQFPIPDDIQGFPSYLRQAGYYCTNNSKTDYNTSNERAIIRASWDACSGKAHWKNRKPGQPFFAVFNDTITHQGPTTVLSYEEFQKKIQSQLAPEERHDPAQAPVPPYWPDTPITRRTIARYYDCITLMDKNVGRLLAELDEAGVADETIVFFYSDHGAGMPRHKRLVLDTGLRVPLLIRFPKKYEHLAPAQPGETVDRLVSFVDFAPTVLSLLGFPIPDYMQGKPFLGPAAAEPRAYVYGARDRVDEAYDLARSVRNGRYLYVRNYMPHLSYHQPEGYSDQAEVRREITRLAAEGKLNAEQWTYAGPTRPREALYDSQADPYQLQNLADSPEHQAILERMRAAHRHWMAETHDLGFLPEAEVWQRAAGTTPYAMARQTDKYPQAEIVAAADLVGRRDALPRQIELLRHPDSAVRYWAAVGLRALGQEAVDARGALTAALKDPSASVRIEAAGVLAALGEQAPLRVLAAELDSPQDDAVLHAARTLQLLGDKARPVLPAMKAALEKHKDGPMALFIRFALAPAIEHLEARDLFARDNLVAWCIVPFDAKRRGPEERAAMLKRLGIRRLAYDWRNEHIPTFDAEVEAMKRHGITIEAWWFPAGLNEPAGKILDVIRRHQIHPQLWISLGDPAPKGSQAEKVQAAAAIIRPVAEEAAKLGCQVALYNHGGWFGEPENQIAILEELKLPNVGIVYNFHHGHAHLDRFPELFRTMHPYLMAVNLNGMVKDGDKQGKKILPLGQGDQELAMLKVIRDSGWFGPIGTLDHRMETDSEATLRENLAGLARLRKEL